MKPGPDDLTTLTTMHNLAAVYSQLERLDRSIPLFEEALKGRERQLTRKHPLTLATAAYLGKNYKDRNRFDDAIRLLSEAYAAGATDASLRWVGLELLDAYVKAKRAADVVQLIDQLLPQARRQVPPESPQLAQKLTQFGLTLLQVKEFAKAESLLRESLAIKQRKEPEAWTTYYLRSQLGLALLGQTKYAAAGPLLVQGYEGLKQREKSIPPQAIVVIPGVLDRLVELYTAMDKPDEAKKYKQLRAQYPALKPAENK